MCSFILCLVCFQEIDMNQPSPKDRSLSVEQQRDTPESGVGPAYFDIRLLLPGEVGGPMSFNVPLDVFQGPLPTNAALLPEFKGVLLRDAFTDPQKYDAQIWLEMKHPPIRKPWDRTTMHFSIRAGSMFPLPDGKLYRASFDSSVLRLSDVTEVFPECDRPKHTSLTISGNCRQSLYPQSTVESKTFGNIKTAMRIESVEFLEDASRTAIVTWHRDAEGGRQASKSEWREYHAIFKMADKGEIRLKRGDEFSTGYRKYKVLNIIPPKDLPDGGHCEGWVELEELERPTPDDTDPLKNE